MPAVPLITDVIISPQLLGRGRFSSVHRAKQQGVDVAAKEYNFACAKHRSDHLARLLCSKLADIVELCHPHLLAILGVYQPQFNHPVIISPLMALGSVRTRILTTDAPPLSFRDALNVNLGLLRGLRFLHEQRCPIVHCRLSDHNVLLDGDGSAKIADYGMSYFLATAFPDECHCGDIVAFLPPEVLTKRHVPSVKADVFAVGVVLMECVLGSVPANGDSLDQQTATRRRMADLHRLHTGESKGSGLPELVQRCFEPQPKKRPSCMQLEDDLQALCVSTDYMWSEQRLLQKTTTDEQSDYCVPRQNAPLAVFPESEEPSQWAEFEQLGADTPSGRSNTALADLHDLSRHMTDMAVDGAAPRRCSAGASTSSGHADLNQLSAEIRATFAQGSSDMPEPAEESSDEATDHYSIIPSGVGVPPAGTTPAHAHVPATSSTPGAYVNVTTAPQQSQPEGLYSYNALLQPEGLYSYNALLQPADVPGSQADATLVPSTEVAAEGHYNVPSSAERHSAGQEGHYSYDALVAPTLVAPAGTGDVASSQPRVTAATSVTSNGHYNIPSSADRHTENHNSPVAAQGAVTDHEDNAAPSASPMIRPRPRSSAPEGHYNIPSSSPTPGTNIQSSPAASNAMLNGYDTTPATAEPDDPTGDPSPPGAANQLDNQFDSQFDDQFDSDPPENHYNVPSSLAAPQSPTQYVALPGVRPLTGLDREPSRARLDDISTTGSTAGQPGTSFLSPTNPFYTNVTAADRSGPRSGDVNMSGSYTQWPSNRPAGSSHSPSNQPDSHSQLRDQDRSSTPPPVSAGEAANPFDDAPSFISAGGTPATLALGNNSPTLVRTSPAAHPTSPRSIQLTMVNSTEPDSPGSRQARKTLTSFLPKAKPRKSKRLSDSAALRSATLETSRRPRSALDNEYSPIPNPPTWTPAATAEETPPGAAAAHHSFLDFDRGAANGVDMRARSLSLAQADTRQHGEPAPAVRRHQFSRSPTVDSISDDHPSPPVPTRRSTMTGFNVSPRAPNTGFHTIHHSVAASSTADSHMARDAASFSQTLGHRETRRQTLSGQPSRPQRRMSESVNAMPYYYKDMSRTQAEDLLSPKSVGTFILRDGSAHGGAFSISLRVADRCKHFRTILDEFGHYRVPGWPLRHASMSDLISYHMKHPISECSEDLLAVPCRKQ